MRRAFAAVAPGAVTAGLVLALAAGASGQAASCAGVYAEKVQPIFDVNCVVCHQDAQPLGNLSLQRSSALKNLVRVASDEVPAMPRITPGDAATSYLIHKLRGTQGMVNGSGERMPFGNQPLADGEIAAIQSWIVDCMAAG